MSRTCLFPIALVASLSAAPCRARADESFHAHPEVSLALQLGLGVAGDRCQGGGDLIGCSRLGLWTFDFAVRQRLSPAWSVGGLAQLGKGDSMTMFHLAVEGRFHPLGQADFDPWLGLDAGAALLVDNVPGSETDRASRFTTFAPAFGAAAGMDFAIGEQVSLGVLLRLLMLPMSRDEARFTRKPSYDLQLLLSAGISATYAWH